MKRLLNILLMSMLSLMVVYLSVGATIMHCLRSDEVKVVMAMGDCCGTKCEKCCADDCSQGGSQVHQHCMDYQQMKLSPTLSIQKAEFDVTPVFVGILPASWLSLSRLVVSYVQKAKLWDFLVPHAPPRAYLAWINILLI